MWGCGSFLLQTIQGYQCGKKMRCRHGSPPSLDSWSINAWQGAGFSQEIDCANTLQLKIYKTTVCHFGPTEKVYELWRRVYVEMTMHTCEGKNKGICSPSRRSAVKRMLFKEQHSRELLLENMADIDHALTGPVAAVAWSTTVCFHGKEEGLALLVKDIAGIIKHSIPKYVHSGLLCHYIAKENTGVSPAILTL